MRVGHPRQRASAGLGCGLGLCMERPRRPSGCWQAVGWGDVFSPNRLTGWPDFSSVSGLARAYKQNLEMHWVEFSWTLIMHVWSQVFRAGVRPRVFRLQSSETLRATRTSSFLPSSPGAGCECGRWFHPPSPWKYSTEGGTAMAGLEMIRAGWCHFLKNCALWKKSIKLGFFFLS